jgi:hypothetical protein
MTCRHLWTIYRRDDGARKLLCKCDRCRRFGMVPDPSNREWNDSAYVDVKPRRWNWKQNWRVELIE